VESGVDASPFHFVLKILRASKGMSRSGDSTGDYKSHAWVSKKTF
jgi:hypothetical protein